VQARVGAITCARKDFSGKWQFHQVKKNISQESGSFLQATYSALENVARDIFWRMFLALEMIARDITLRIFHVR